MFEYNDKRRIINSCKRNKCLIANNGKNIALIANKKEYIFKVFDECFEKYTYSMKDDIIFLNMDCDKK